MNELRKAIAESINRSIRAHIKAIITDLHEAEYRRVPSYRFEVKAVQPMRKKGQVAQWKREGHGYR